MPLEKKNLAPTADMVGMSAAKTMLMAASKARDRALLNMMRRDIPSSESGFEGDGQKLRGLSSSEHVAVRNERLRGW